MAGKGYILVEGKGEVLAAGNLIARLWGQRAAALPWKPPRRRVNLHVRRGMVAGAEYVRAQRDAGALLVLRDEDDECPRTKAPEMASWLRELQLPFPTALVFFHPEYEVLFLPCVERLAGQPIIDESGQRRPGLKPGTVHHGQWEANRGVKEWLSRNFPPGRRYKPTLDQLPLTRQLDLEAVRRADVPCFGTLERALDFLANSIEAGTAGVYPPSASG